MKKIFFAVLAAVIFFANSLAAAQDVPFVDKFILWTAHWRNFSSGNYIPPPPGCQRNVINVRNPLPLSPYVPADGEFVRAFLDIRTRICG